MVPSPDVVRMANAMRRPNLPPWLPRTPGPQFHAGWVTGIDHGRNQLDFMFNDYGNPLQSGVPILQAYSAASLPQEDDVAVLLQMGPRVAAVGRLIAPTGIVTF